jgi:tryptophanyl-tRNA synthetase
MRATGRIHLGNYFGAVKNWVELQDRYRCFYFIADWHALTTDYAEPSDVGGNSLEMLADLLASGLDPERCVIFVQSMVPEHAELHLLLSMITPLGWLERVPTYKEQIKELSNKDLSTYGFLGYPVLQTADILLYRAQFVPVGEDQASHLELSREIGRRFNSYYGEIFPEPKALFTPTPKVPGLDGRKEVTAKCREMFTDPQRLRRKDAGHPETCNLFQFHRLFSTPELQEKVAGECRRAQIGCVDDKQLIADQINSFLDPIRDRRAELLKSRDTLLDILNEGSAKAAERARETMDLVRSALSIQYR